MPEAARAAPTPTTPEASETLPRRFGKYTLIRRMAAGGMAVLYLAIHKTIAGIERLLVIKRILPEYGRDKGYIEMLLKEARIATTFAHPNIVTVFDVGQVDGEYFIAMEHIHGEDLRSVVRAMKPKGATEFPLEHALSIGIGVAAGLAYAHDKRDMHGVALRVVHRDISPQNIVVSFSGDVKVVDFGIAKAHLSRARVSLPPTDSATAKPHRDPSGTGSGQVRRGERDPNVSLVSGGEGTDAGKVKGKVPYMSPEQARGDELDHRSDIFSLGIMLFELCTGRRLFRAGNDTETLKLITDGEYPSAAAINPRVTPGLDAVIARALSPDREDRYQNARALQADLEAVSRTDRIPVSSVSLGEWMRMLFAERIIEQDSLLAESKNAVDEMADHGAEDHGVRPVAPAPAPAQNKTVAVATGVGLTLLLVGGGYALSRDPVAPGALTAAQNGVISVRSTPPGAHIWINDSPTPHVTPHDLTGLASGPESRFRIRVTADGFEPFSADVSLAASRPRQEVNATLQRARAAGFAVLAINTTPPGARALVDGREVPGVTPVTVPGLQAGVQHSVLVQSPEHVDESFTFVGEAGRVETRALTLRERPLGPNEAWVQLVTEPAAAHIRFGTTVRTTGSPYRVRVEVGPRPIVIEVDAPGYESESRSVRAIAGQSMTVRPVRLSVARESGGHTTSAPPPPPPPPNAADTTPGQIRVGANPWCTVSVDGRSFGESPISTGPIAPGSHRVSCANPAVPTRSRVVNLAPGQRMSVVFGAQ